MKKNLLTKVMTLALAATMALTPVTASAAEEDSCDKRSVRCILGRCSNR